jgi:hypothetical protein
VHREFKSPKVSYPAEMEYAVQEKALMDEIRMLDWRGSGSRGLARKLTEFIEEFGIIDSSFSYSESVLLLRACKCTFRNSKHGE